MLFVIFQPVSMKKLHLFLHAFLWSYLFFMSKFHFKSVTFGNINLKIQVVKMGRRPKNSSRGRKQYKEAVEKTQHVLPVPAVCLLKWPPMVVKQSTKFKPEKLGSNWFWCQLFVYKQRKLQFGNKCFNMLQTYQWVLSTIVYL